MSQSTTFEQLPLFSFDKIPYWYCPNCYVYNHLFPRSDIDAIECSACDTIVDGSMWEKPREQKVNSHLANLIKKYGSSEDSDW
ncbi:hypothetical protein SEA_MEGANTHEEKILLA_167 [Streptomyces phage MeganTheeKilla]|uniref:Uncharacterized protein n=1 Tax=Streptomyces phage MeganTheeKilla TaxID=2801897 RepID=A0A7U0GC95_9CAUD|nr:hypothetical protein SEA_MEGANTHEEKILLA_167 [Streptomyces phage MeganTheeKilla]